MIDTPFGPLEAATHQVMPGFGEVWRIPLEGAAHELSVARTTMSYGNKSGEGLWEVLEFDGADAVGEPVGWQDERQVRTILRDEWGFDLPDVVKVRELLLDAYWAVNATRGWTGEDPQPNEGPWFSPAIHNTRYDEDEVEVLEIPAATWGEYINCSAVERANFNVLADEYAEHIILAEWFHDTHAVYLRLDQEIPAEFFDRLLGLADYPLLDEDEMSAVERKLEQDDWDGFGRHDLQLSVERTLDEIEDEGQVPGLVAAEFYLTDARADAIA